MLSLLLVIVGILLFLGSTWGVGIFILGPAAERERAVRAPTRYMLSDLLWLIVLMQAALAPVAALGSLLNITRPEEIAMQRALFVLVFSAVLAVWWGTMRMFSRAGVHSQVRRGVLMAVVVPLTILLMFSLPLSGIYLACWVTFPFLDESTHEYPGLTLLITLGIITATFPLAWVLRRVVLWGLNNPAAIPPVGRASEAGEVALEAEESS